MKDWFKRHFIPHEQNDYAPHILQEAAVVGMLGLAILSFSVANIQSLLWVTSDWLVSTILPAVIIAETNQERASENLTPLVRNETLDAAAKLKAQDMADKEYFSHYSPEGLSPWYWFVQAEYKYVHAGENLAIHFTDSSEVVEAWMKSPTHRENIMNGKYQEIGIGTAKGEYEGYPTVYVVQLFGTPQAKKVVPTEAVSPNLPSSESVALPSVPTVTEQGTVLSAEESEPEQDITEQEEKADATPEPAVEEVEVPVQVVPPVFASTQSLQEEVVIEPIEAPAETTVEKLATTSTEAPEVITKTPGSVAYLEHISTSTGGLPATATPLDSDIHTYTTAPTMAFATQPHKWLQMVYIVLGSFVTFALVLSILIEIRRQKPLQVLYGTGLVVAMMLLLYVHISVSAGVTIL